VVKTKGQLPRRFDGLVRAGGTFAKHGGGSIGSVGGKGPKAGPGRYAVTVSAKDADGKTVSSTKTITLRDRKPGDRSGKPIYC
jgi:hypothetical protein